MSSAIPYIIAAYTIKTSEDARRSQNRSQDAQNKYLQEQRQTIAKQEEVQVKQQTELAQEAQTRARAKRAGGLRTLLSGSELGLSGSDTTTTKLGGGS